jgi:hypothetical protein
MRKVMLLIVVLGACGAVTLLNGGSGVSIVPAGGLSGITGGVENACQLCLPAGDCQTPTVECHNFYYIRVGWVCGGGCQKCVDSGTWLKCIDTGKPEDTCRPGNGGTCGNDLNQNVIATCVHYGRCQGGGLDCDWSPPGGSLCTRSNCN